MGTVYGLWSAFCYYRKYLSFFEEFYIDGIMQHVLFTFLLLLLSVIFWGFILVVMYISKIFLYIVGIYHISTYDWIFRVFPDFVLHSLLLLCGTVSKCNSLKQHTFVISQTSGLEIWAQFSWAFCKPANKAPSSWDGRRILF